MQAPVGQRYGRPVSEPEPATEARRIATEARDRARFEEEALALADQVYRVARRLVGSREEAEFAAARQADYRAAVEATIDRVRALVKEGRLAA